MFVLLTGISYLSRAQEPAAKLQLRNPVRCSHFVKSPSSLSVADAVFVGRIKSRIKQWKDSCKDLTKTDGTKILLDFFLPLMSDIILSFIYVLTLSIHDM